MKRKKKKKKKKKKRISLEYSGNVYRLTEEGMELHRYSEKDEAEVLPYTEFTEVRLFGSFMRGPHQLELSFANHPNILFPADTTGFPTFAKTLHQKLEEHNPDVKLRIGKGGIYAAGLGVWFAVFIMLFMAGMVVVKECPPDGPGEWTLVITAILVLVGHAWAFGVMGNWFLRTGKPAAYTFDQIPEKYLGSEEPAAD